MNKICGIYKITSPTGKIYIGQSVDINRRLNSYKSTKCKRQPKLYNSIIKYGWNAHEFEIICECEESKLNELEKYYIKQFNCFDTKNGMNLTDGGDHFKFNEKFRERMRIFMKDNKYWLGKHHSDETKQKLSIASKGRKHTKESILLVANKNRGQKRSDETKQKMRMAQLGKKHTKESILKMCIASKGRNLGMKFSDEIKKKMSIAQLGKKFSEEAKQKMSMAHSNNYEIYNQNNELIYKFKSNIKKELKKLKLPRESFCNTYKYNIKINKGKYKDWYIIKL